MATTTITAQGKRPTKEEISAALVRYTEEWPHDNAYSGLEAAADNLIDDLACHRLNAQEAWDMGDDYVGDLIWRGLSPAEEKRLHQLLRSAKIRAVKQAFATMVAIVAEAGAQFAVEYPDAPQAVREAVQA